MPRLIQYLPIQANSTILFQHASRHLHELYAWWPQLEQCEIVAATAEDERPHIHYTYQLMGIGIKGEAEVYQYQPPHYLLIRATAGIQALIELAFEAEGNVTHLTVTADYSLPGALLGSMTHRPALEQQLEGDIAAALERFKISVEALSETEP
ncbi:MAG: SRPBCC family protein [Anaerolineae bacterium]|nr:SRPBCC family protein [Anaerolineae bacterium]